MMANDDINVNEIFYKSDDFNIQCYILQKEYKKENSDKKPVIIYCRGGNSKYGEITSKQPKLYCGDMIRNNHIVYAINYRGGGKSEGIDEFGGSEVIDIINLYDVIKKNKICDLDNIIIYGLSRGCMEALLVASKVNWVKSIILNCGVYNLLEHIEWRKDMADLLRNKYKLSDKELTKRSPKYTITRINKNINILILHGQKDTKIQAMDALKLYNKCVKHNIKAKLIIYPEGEHCLTDIYREVRNDISNWLKN